MAKINIDDTMDDIVSIQNQIDGLNLLLIQKKQTMAKFFEKSGKRSLSNADCTVYVQERTTIDYDIDKMLEVLPKELADQIVKKEYFVVDWKTLVQFFKKLGIKGDTIRPFFHVHRELDKQVLSKLYEQGKITLQDLEGCYTAKVTKSVALRLKDAKREINLT